MTNKIMIAAAIAFILVGLLIGFPVGKGCKQCPEIKIGVETTFVSVLIHDTVTVEKRGKDIIVEKRIIQKIKDSSNIVIPDTTTCLAFDEIHDDGAYTKCEVCSDSLPVSSENVQGTITYTAPPDTEKTFSRVDTVTFTKPVPLHKDWKTYAIGVLVSLVTGLLLASR